MSMVPVLTIGKSLINPFLQIQDRRLDRNKEHKLIDILVVAICATLAGADGFVAIADWGRANQSWLSRFLELPNGIPSHDTFGRVFSLLNPDEFQKAFREWVQLIKKHSPQREIYAIDGKFLRGSTKEASNSRSALILINVWATKAGLSVAQLTSRLKKEEGEKRTMERIIDCIDVKGNILTFDAGGATTRIYNKVVSLGGDAVIGLKKNQKSLLKLAEHIFGYEKNKDLITSYSTEEKGHGRIEKRKYESISFDECKTSGMAKVFRIQKEKWGKVKGLVKVVSERTEVSKKTTSLETRYYIASFDDNIQELSEAIRGHWGVENKLHWQLDVTFREDYIRARTGHSGENLAVLRQVAINLFKAVDQKVSMRRKRMMCGWDPRYLLKVLLSDESTKSNFAI